MRTVAGGPAPVDDVAAAIVGLLRAVRGWSQGAPVDEAELTRLRDAVLVTNHARYVEHVPAYRPLAVDSGLAGPVCVADLAERMLLEDGFFRSYDPSWLHADLPALTDWLDTVCTHRLRGTPVRAAELAGWREELKARGIAVTLTSATSGPPGLVPRDRATLAALRTAGGVHVPWAALPQPHDALLLVAAGTSSGLAAGATGLAARAARVHHLAAGGTVPDHDRAWAFVTASAREGRPLLVFGAPATLVELLDHAERTGVVATLAPGSVVVTGGGWKRGAAQPPAEVTGRAAALLGIPASRCADTYSTSELNTVIVSCSVGRYHVPPSLHVVILDDLLVPAQEGAGRLGFLDPFALSYPGFVATGDHALLRRDPCPCGLSGATVEGPITRTAAAPDRGCGTAVSGP